MTRAQQIKEIQALIEKARRKISPAFIEGIKRLRDSETIQKALALIKAGRYDAAISLVDERLIQNSMTGFLGKVTEAASSGGAVASAIMREVNIATHFSVVNPFTATAINSYNLRLIRQITSDTRKTIKASISSGITAGDNPLTVARDVKQSIGLTSNQWQAVDNYRNLLENPTKAALNRALRDQRFDANVLRSIANDVPIPPEKIDRMVERYTEKYVKYRSETIARTEATRATNSGKQMMFEQAIHDGELRRNQVRRFWIYTHDSKVRESHAAIPDLNPDGVGMDEPFKTGDGNLAMYPGDPSLPPADSISCRCSLYLRVVAADEVANTQEG